MSVFADPGSRSYARVAGALYLLIAISGGFAIAFVPAQLYVPGDLAASVQSLIDARGMFLAGIAGDVTMMVSELLVTPMLFFMFRSTNPTLSLAAALARLAWCRVWCPRDRLAARDPLRHSGPVGETSRVNASGLGQRS